ncbi:MAG: HlyD family efflux transporter periplasmic adaptor subunit [Pirellulaceae bacterium]|nr:HlyD family efflux transporter periplasmic adaptor subunit [Pirellulaceae bacterium]
MNYFSYRFYTSSFRKLAFSLLIVGVPLFCLSFFLPEKKQVLATQLTKEQNRHATEPIVIPLCLVSLIQDVRLSAQEAGPITAMNIKEGDYVQANTLLVQINDDQPQLQKKASHRQLLAAQVEANDDIEVRFAEAAFAVAKAELEQDEQINKRSPGAVPEADIRRLKLAREQAALQIDRSRLNLKVAKLTAEIKQDEVDASQLSIQRRKIVAPTQGLIWEIQKQKGEWVNVGEPILRIIQMDKLRVVGRIRVDRANPSDLLGKPVTIEAGLAGNQKFQIQGQVTLIDPIVGAGNNYRIRAEVNNMQHKGQWLLRPGMNASMLVHQ